MAPGDPGAFVRGIEGAHCDCGETRLRVCANAGAAAKRKITAAAAAAAAAVRRRLFKPHPDIAIFLDPNRGNFKPRPGRSSRAGMLAVPPYLADSALLSPYPEVQLVG